MLITSDVTAIASILTGSKGAVVAYPTETVYGLGSLVSDHAALERIILIKGRESSKGMIILASDMNMAASLAEMDHRQSSLLSHFWPGPLSVLLVALPGMDPLLAPGGKIALRISPHPLALSLIGRTGPVTSTSANVSGFPPARTPEEIVKQNLPIDGLLDGGKTPGSKPSTLIDLTRWPPLCLREGIIPFAEILKVT
jgi:L-threonylcarbamoyladenylate synthase